MIEATMGKLCGVSSASVVLSLRPISKSGRALPSALDEPEAGEDCKLTLVSREGRAPLAETLLGIAALEEEIWIDSSKSAIEMIWSQRQLEAPLAEESLDFPESGHLQGQLLFEVPGTPSRPISPLYILLVEDRSDAVLAGLLEGCGHAVFTAPDMLAGLALAENCRFDLVISDITLPDGSGYELMERLRFTRPSLAGIAMSGFGMPSDIDQSRKAGFSEHLHKPVTLKNLRSAIQAIAA
jgi:CheY-like chemotaxis protein